MNHLYRTVWNELTKTFVAVAENVKRRGKRSSGTCDAAPASPAHRPGTRRTLVTPRPQMLALEPRLVFDGAAVDTLLAADIPAPPPVEAGEPATDGQEAPIAPSAVQAPAAGERKEILVIDTRVDDYQTLLQGLSDNIDVILLQGNDGLAELAAALANRNDIDALHIVSHGGPGQLHLGATTLDAATLESQRDTLAQIGAALADTGDILLYGCEVGAGETGQAFIDQLAQLTGADVAASSDLTGHAAPGGNWVLEVAQGPIETPLPFNPDTLQDYDEVLATAPVNGTTGFTGLSGTSSVTSGTSTGIRTATSSNYGATGWDVSVSAANPNLTLNASVTFYIATGNGLSDALIHNAGSTNTLRYGSIVSNDGSEFKLLSLKALFNSKLLGNTDPASISFSGYKDGGAVAGATQTVELTTSAQTISFNSNFVDIDEIRWTAPNANYGYLAFDDITITIPPAVDLNGADAGFNHTATFNEVLGPDDGSAAVSFAASGTNLSSQSSATLANLKVSIPVAQVTTGDQLRLDATTIDITGTTASGTVSYGGANFNYAIADASGTRTITFTGTNLLAAYEALLDALKYNHTSDAPVDGSTRVFSVTTNDGTESSAAATFTVTLAATNEIPVIANLNGNASSFIVSSTTPVKLDTDTAASVSDVDHATFGNTGYVLVAQSSSGSIATGNLSFDGTTVKAGADGVITAGERVTVGGTDIGVVTTIAAASNLAGERLKITFDNGAATPALISTLLQNLYYTETVSNETTGGRSFDISVHDGAGVSSAATVTLTGTAKPTITSATFDWQTGTVVLTGTDFVAQAGANNDIVANKLTFSVAAGDSYTLDSTANVEITNSTTATLTLSATDLLHVRGILNNNGTANSGSAAFNLAAADDWLASASAASIADATTPVTVSNVQTPSITSATYDSSTGELIVTGTNLFKKVGANNDIDVQKLTFTGEGGSTYTINDATADIEITSATSFTMTLAGADKAGVDALLNKIGTKAADNTTYNLAAAEDWLAGADSAATIVDATSPITVAITPRVTSATYNASTGVLVVTGSSIQANSGGADIDASKITLTGEGGATYTLTDTPDVERTSITEFTLTLSATDKAAVNQMLNKNGTASTGGTAYNLAVADDWNTSITEEDTSDTTGNGITVSHVPAPTITSATYNSTTGALVVTGMGFLKRDGAANDIVANKFTISGQGGAGAAYTLTDTANVDITSATSFTLTLSATDKAAINLLINKDGTASTDNTTYNLAAAEDWAAGADAAVVIVDETGNGITATLNAAPVITSNGGGATASVNVAENTSAVTTVTASDTDNDTLSFSITGGADAAKFNINATTGALTFASAPDFEAPTDSDANNTYVVEVTVSDGKGGTDVQAITVTVTDVNEVVILPPPPPTFTSAPPPSTAPDTNLQPPQFVPTPTVAPPAVASEFSVTQPSAPDAPSVTPPPAPTTPTPATSSDSGSFTRSDGFQIAVRPAGAGSESGLFVTGNAPDLVIDRTAGSFEVAIPRDLFGHTDPNVSVTLTAARDDGQPLPSWMRFDPVQGVFSGEPPANFEGELVIRVIARDSEGREVVTTFRIKVGEGGAAETAPQSLLPGKRPLSEQLAAARFGLKPVANDPLMRHVRVVSSLRA